MRMDRPPICPVLPDLFHTDRLYCSLQPGIEAGRGWYNLFCLPESLILLYLVRYWNVWVQYVGNACIF